MCPKHLTTSALLALLVVSAMLGCADKPTEPELTEEDVARIVAEALAKTVGMGGSGSVSGYRVSTSISR